MTATAAATGTLDLEDALTGQDGVVLSSPDWWTESTLY